MILFGRDPVEECRKCAEICAREPRCGRGSIWRHNRAVGRMRAVVSHCALQGPEGVEPLFALIDDPVAGPWLVHPLLELCNVPPEIEERCLASIHEMARES